MAQTVVQEMTRDDDNTRPPIALTRSDACHDLNAWKLIAGQFLIGGVNEHNVDLLPVVSPGQCLGVIQSGNQLDVRTAAEASGKASGG